MLVLQNDREGRPGLGQDQYPFSDPNALLGLPVEVNATV
jgi:hypothetical protein